MKHARHARPHRGTARVDTLVVGVCLTLIGIVGTVILSGWFAPGHAHGWQPYGGCKEAWQAPHSEGAAACRAHGWTVRHRIVVNPRRHVRYENLQPCREEDGSGQRRTCSWNFPGDHTGNGRGLSYFVTHAPRRFHYVVWPTADPRMLTRV